MSWSNVFVRPFADAILFMRRHPGVMLILATLLVMIVLARGSAALITGEAPEGGRTLQSPATVLEVDRILWSWRVRDLLPFASRHIWIDYAFILAYVSLLAYCCRWLQKRLVESGVIDGARLAHAGIAAAVLAGLLDAAENAGMLQFIANFEHQQSSPPWLVHAVFACSTAKWLLIVSCCVVIVRLDVRRLGGSRRGARMHDPPERA